MKSLTFPFLLCALILYFPQRCSERHGLEVARTANSCLTSLKLLKKLPCTNDTDPPSFPFGTLSEWREEDPSNRKILEGGITLRWVYMQNTDTETISAFRFRLYWLLVVSSSIWVAMPVDWVILHWYACGEDGRWVYGHLITKFSRMVRLVHFLTHGALNRERLETHARESAIVSVIHNRIS